MFGNIGLASTGGVDCLAEYSTVDSIEFDNISVV